MNSVFGSTVFVSVRCQCLLMPSIIKLIGTFVNNEITSNDKKVFFS